MYLIKKTGEIFLDKNIRSTKTDRLHAPEEKKTLPVFVKYGLIAIAVIAAIVIGILIYYNVVGGYVATVDGQKIKAGEFKYYLVSQKETMLANAQAEDPNISAETFWATKIGGNDPVEVAKKLALNSLKETKIQYAKAKEAKVSLAADQIKAIDDSIQSSIVDKMDPNNNNAAGTGNKIRASKALEKQYGFTVDDLRNVQIENYTVKKYMYAEIDKTTDANANVDTYYSKNPEWYKEDTQLRTGAEEAVWARHILIAAASTATQTDKDAAKKKAEDLIAKLKGGADFAALAKESSEDPGSKDKGGAYLFGKGASFYPEFKEAAFALNPGQITETPVLTGAGYHIIKLEEKYAKDEPVSLKCAKEYDEYGTTFVKYKLYMEKVAGWIKDAKYEENTTVYNSIK